MQKNTKYILLIIVFIFIYQTVFAGEYLKVYYKQINEKEYAFYADNTNFCPYQVIVKPVITKDLITDESVVPVYKILQPQKTEVYLFSVFSKIKSQNLQIKFTYKYYLGDPVTQNQENNNYGYLLPYEEGTELKVTQGYNGRFSHRGWTNCSIDFGMNIGTSVCAARDGIVVTVKDNSKIGGRSYKYRFYANYIIIYHNDGTFSEYMHLEQNGSMVRVGDSVKAGDIIGYSGNTGWSKGPHLHFMVFKPEYMTYYTIPTKFVGENGALVELEIRKTYFSYHNKDNYSPNGTKIKPEIIGIPDTDLGGY